MPAYRFLLPFPDGTVRNVPPGDRDLAEAYDLFRRYWWDPGTVGAIAVSHNHALVARVLPVLNIQSEKNEPLLQE
jgi:hypothetical protein